jgi:ABC-type sugar transport system ATPase subunit
MTELCRFINVGCETNQYNVKYINVTLNESELIVLSSDSISTKECIMFLLTGKVENTSGNVKWKTEVAHIPPAVRSVIVSFETFPLNEELSVAENLMPSFQKKDFFYSPKKYKRLAEELLMEYEIKVNASKMVYRLSALEQYCICIIKAVQLGAKCVILDRLEQFLTKEYVTELNSFIKKLRLKGIAILVPESSNVEVLDNISKIFCLEAGLLTRILYNSSMFLGLEATYSTIINTSLDFNHFGRMQREKQNCRICLKEAKYYQEADISISVGEVSYMLGQECCVEEFIEAIFGVKAAATININKKTIQCASMSQLKKYGVGFFPADIRKISFPTLTYEENCLIHVLEMVSYKKFILKKSLLKYVSRKCMPEYFTLEKRKVMSDYMYTLQLEAMIKRYELYPWKLLVLELPPLTKGQIETKKIKELILSVIKKGGSVLLICSTVQDIIGQCDSVITVENGIMRKQYQYQ